MATDKHDEQLRHQAFLTTVAPTDESAAEPANRPTQPGDRPPAQQSGPMAPARLSVTATDEDARPQAREPTPSSRDEPLGSGAVFGQYELIRELGRGGMGAVFLARDTRLGRRVAIKFLMRDDPRVAERFLAEARVTARCKHENIVLIHDAGESRGYSYMVLEYLEGMTLRTWLEDLRANRGSGRVSAAQAAEMCAPIVRALVHAHARGMVHRDVKPENIMLTESGATKVLDFGIAHVLGPTNLHSGVHSQEFQALLSERGFKTQEGALVGTLPYMSPEQLRGDPVDARTDIWALGIILWELVAGRHPLKPVDVLKLERLMDGDQPMPSISDAGTHTDLGPLADVIDHCLETQLDRRMPSAQALLDALAPALARASAPATAADGAPDNPYIGLAAFQRTDADRFFGREDDVVRVTEQLRRHRLVAVAGASGAGKSSFIRAGVIPALERAGQPWEAFIARPGRRPLAALGDIVAQLVRTDRQGNQTRQQAPGVDSREQMIASLREQPGYLGAVLRARGRTRQSRILLFIDQFEELYTLNADRETRAAFVACIEGVADDPSSPLRVILSVRADFLDRVAEDRTFTSELTRSLTLLSPLSREQLRAALTGPLAAAGYSFESQALIDAMLDSLEATRSPLPLLQFTAARLWDARDVEGKRITRASHDALGGIEGALATHADAVLAGLSGAEQRLVRAVFTRLVSEERTRAIVSMDELRASVPAEQGQDLKRVVDRLADARLLHLDASGERASASVEIVHESLIERWARLGRWLDERQEDAEFFARLGAAARQWQRRGRDEGLLWRGQAALEARQWLELRQGSDDSDLQMGARDASFLHAVVALAERAKRRRRRLAMAVMAILAAITAAMVVLALDARQAARRAEASEDEVRRKHADLTRETRHGRALALMRASNLTVSLTTRLALLREVTFEPTPAGWAELVNGLVHRDIATSVLHHPAAVHAVAFSPDSRRIVTGGDDKTIRVWHIDGPDEPDLLLDGHDDSILSVQFSPEDGNLILSASADRTVRLWRAVHGASPLHTWNGHTDKVVSVRFSRDGKRIVSASADRTARIWNADGSGQPLRFDHDEGVTAAEFNRDSTRVVTASEDGKARVWDARPIAPAEAPLVVLYAKDDEKAALSSATFTRDGQRIITASRSSKIPVRVWDPAQVDQKPIAIADASDVLLSADGTRLLTAQVDIALRDARTYQVQHVIVVDAPVSADGMSVYGISSKMKAYSRGHRWLATANVQSNKISILKVTDLPPAFSPPTVGTQAYINVARFSLDGSRAIAAAGWQSKEPSPDEPEDDSAWVWNADGSGEPVVLRGHKDGVWDAAFSPDGYRVVTASRDHTARVWNADGSGEPEILAGHTDEVLAVVFSPDGSRVATASKDRTARVWRVDDQNVLAIFKGHKADVNSVAFHRDGQHVLTASDDGTARIWNVARVTDGPIGEVRHDGAVFSALYNADGTRILTASEDQTARIWDAETTKLVDTLMHNGSVYSAMFSTDGRIFTWESGGRWHVWSDLSSGEHITFQMSVKQGGVRRDGGQVLISNGSRGIRVVDNPKPVSVDDPRLWRVSTYCMPVAERQRRLSVSEKIAHKNREKCLRRVSEARRSNP